MPLERTIFRREEVDTSRPQAILGPGRDHLADRRGEGKINGAICLLTDLTELAALQQRMQFKENLAALGELSAGIAHEFKNALATISGYAQMIQSESSETEAFGLR